MKENSQFRLVWIGQIFSRIGDGIFLVVLLWLVHRIGTASDLGFVMGSFTSAFVIFGFIGGIVSDRFSRKKLMFTSALLTAALVSLIPLTLRMDIICIPILALLSFLVSMSSQFFEPALEASIPNLVDEDYLKTANSLNSTTMRVGRAVGPLLAGFLISIIFIGQVFIISSFSFLILGIIIFRVKIPQNIPDDGLNSVFNILKRDINNLIGELKNNRVIINLLSLVLIVNGLAAPLLVIAPVLTENVLDGSSAVFGSLISFKSVGTIVGLVSVGFIKNVSGKNFVFSALFLQGATFIVLGFLDSVFGVLISFFLLGLGVGIAIVIIKTNLQSKSLDQTRGKVMGIAFTLAGAAEPIGQTFSGPLIEFLGVKILLIGMGIFTILITIFFYMARLLEGVK